MSAVALSAALLAGLATSLAVVGGVRLFAAHRVHMLERLARRIGGGGAPAMIAVSEDVLIRRETVSGPLSKLFSRGEGAEQTRTMLERADLPLLPHEFFTMKLIIAAVMIGAGYIAAGYAGGSVIQAIGAAGGGVIGYIAPGWYAKRRISQRAALIEDQLVEMLELMSSSMQAGFGYMQALVATAQQLDPPLSTEIMKMIDEVNLGGDIDVALEALADRLQSRDFEIVSIAITIQRTAGGNLGEILRGVAETIRGRQSFKRDVAALTAKEKQTAKIMTGFPLIMTAGLMFMAPDPFMRLITDTAGQIALGAALTLDTIAYVVITRMTRIEV